MGSRWPSHSVSGVLSAAEEEEEEEEEAGPPNS